MSSSRRAPEASSFLIAAATGRVARRVVAALGAQGATPRVLVRDADRARDVLVDAAGAPLPVEIVVGDLADRDAVGRALDGIDVAFLALGSSLQQVDLENGFIDAASRSGLPHLVKLSAARPAHDAVAPVLRWHAAIEDHLRASGLPHTLIQPTSFADLILLAAASIREHDRWQGTAPTGRNALIDSDDVVDAIVAVLTDPAKRGRAYEVTGPEALSWPEVAERLTAVLGRPITYDAVSRRQRRADLAAAGVDEWRIDLRLGVDALSADEVYPTPNGVVRQLTGHEPRRVSAFLERHRAAFEAPAA